MLYLLCILCQYDRTLHKRVTHCGLNSMMDVYLRTAPSIE